MSATVEAIQSIRVLTDGKHVVLAMEGLKEDVRIVCDLRGDIASKMTSDLIAAGFGPQRAGGVA